MQTNETPNQNPRPSADHRRSSAFQKGRRGGRRHAGAPRGNLNALKHGRRSRQFAEIGAILAADPRTVGVLLEHARLKANKDKRADQIAASLAANLYIQARLIAQGKPVSGRNYGIHKLLAEAKATNVALLDEEEAALAQTLAEIDRQMKNARANNRPLLQQSDRPHENGRLIVG